MRGQLGRHLCQQPRLLHDSVDQVGLHIGKAQLGHAGGDPLLGVAPPLGCQPLRARRQPHLQSRQRRLHLPVADPKLAGDPGDAGAGVAAILQVGPKVLEPQHPSTFHPAPIAAAVDPKSARKDQPMRRFCWSWVCPCVAGGAAHGEPYGQHRSTASPPRSCRIRGVRQRLAQVV